MTKNKIKRNTTISIIVPVYNTEPFLRECLDSILNQTFKEIEIICVNDGSTDNSLSILEEYRKKDCRLIILSQENKGPGAARNKGLDIAKGKYLSILDSDDIYDVTMLEKMYSRAEELQTDIIVCLSEAFDNVTKKVWNISWSAMEIKEDIFCYKDTLKICQTFDFLIGWSWDKFFKKSFIDKYEFRFQEISHHDDGLFVFCAMYSSERISILREILIKHRINREGSVELTHHKNPHCIYDMHKAIKAGLKKINVFPEVKERYAIWTIRHALWLLSVIRTGKSFSEVFSMLQKNIFPESKVCNLPPEFFYDKLLYEEMQKVKELSAAEYLFNQRNTARRERDRLQGERDRLQGERDHLQGENEEIKSDYNHISASLSFRLGRLFTWFPRKVRGFFRKLR